jgi:hypothetical protein
VALLPFALGAAYLGFARKSAGWLAVAAVFCALVVSNNFYGATSLAILFPPLVWSMWLTRRDYRIWLRALAVAALGYGLTAFWLVPSYLRITMRNLDLVSLPGNRWSIWLALATATVFAFVTWKLARGRPERAYAVFLWGMFTFMTLNVLGYYYFNFRVAGEPHRLTPELDMVMILLAVEGLRQVWNRFPIPVVRLALGAVMFLCFVPAYNYLRHAHHVIVRDGNYQGRIEYQLTKWIAEHLPGSRNLATGSVRFWYDGWFNLAQIGGGSEQGMMNYATYEVQWQITREGSAEASTLWMQALGGDNLVVHFKNSREMYHDWAKPDKLAGHLPVVYDNGAGDVIYQVPRRFPDHARVVETAKVRALAPVLQDPNALRPYVDAIENGPEQPAHLTREGTDAMQVSATLKPGQSIVVQETYDPAWHAYAGSRPLEIREDPAGFMEIAAPEGQQQIRLVFEPPLENLLGRVITCLSAAALLVWAYRGARQRT